MLTGSCLLEKTLAAVFLRRGASGPASAADVEALGSLPRTFRSAFRPPSPNLRAGPRRVALAAAQGHLRGRPVRSLPRRALLHRPRPARLSKQHGASRRVQDASRTCPTGRKTLSKLDELHALTRRDSEDLSAKIDGLARAVSPAPSASSSAASPSQPPASPPPLPEARCHPRPPPSHAFPLPRWQTRQPPPRPTHPTHPLVCVGWLRRRGGPPPAPPPRLPPPPQALARGRRTSRSAVAATGANRPRAGRPRAGLRSPEEDAAGACRRSPAERALRFTGTDAARRRPVGPVEPWPCAARQHRRHRALLAHKPLRHIRCCKVCPCPPAES